MAGTRIVNLSVRPEADLHEIVDFAFEKAGGISRLTAFKLVDNYGGGYASNRREHRFPKWAGRASYAVRASVWPDNPLYYEHARVCGHASGWRRMTTDGLTKLYEQGERRFGRWPIYRLHDWREALVHLLAHEMLHVIQYDRERRSRSEVDCEVFAEWALDAWRSRCAILKA